ncbi:MAG: asparagine synthase (glutamine-hydrolyzing), partial [Chloroflexi bacterium]|nr:asparagine synthase (glutamine-hydrolyzing) [Chloroflexota bacterium]
PRAVNSIALDEYLVYGYVPTPNTLFKDVMKLPAAHVLVYEDGQISTKRYWELPFTPTCQDDEATAIERTRALLKEAVQIRLMSEVPLGAFLSGGIDSSMVVGLMSSMMSQPVKTFSIGFEEDSYNELPYARQIAKHFGTDHHEFFVRPDLVSVLPQLVWAYDEPFADSSMLPTYYVSKLAREHVTVVLTGDGGDEIFGGYPRYEYQLSIQRIPAFVRSICGNVSMLMPKGTRGKNRLRDMARDLASRYVPASVFFQEGSRPTMYQSAYFAEVCDHNPYERQISEFQSVSQLDGMAQMQYVDVRTYLADDILVKVDKASMFNSLETRAPLLDQQLVEYVSSLPTTLRTRSNTLKYLLKKVAADMLPGEVLTRSKQGFGVPIKHWFRSELLGYAHELLDAPRAHQRGIFNPAFVRGLLQAHASTEQVNHSQAIWALLCLELWFQIYMDEPPSTPVGKPAQIHITSAQ